MNTSKQAAIYARVATDDLNGGGLSTQVEACRQYAEQHGFTVAEEHIIAEVFSGIRLRRPGLDRIQALTAGPEADVVIVTTPDRLSRDADHLLSMYEKWQQIGIDLRYASR